jgi:hypothetical protein
LRGFWPFYALSKERPFVRNQYSPRAPDLAELLRQGDRLRKLVEETFQDPQCLDPTIFDRDRILEMFQEHLQRKADYYALFLLLLTFGRWHKRFGPGTNANPA